MQNEHLPGCYKAINKASVIMKAPLTGAFFALWIPVLVNKYLTSPTYHL